MRFYGHSQAEIDALPYRDVQLFMTALPFLQRQHHLAGVGNGD